MVIPTPVVTPTVEPIPFSQSHTPDILGSLSQGASATSIEPPRPVLTPIAPMTDPMSSIGTTPAQEVTAEIPDWLKSTTDRLTNVPEVERVPEAATEDSFANISQSQIPPSIGTPPESELPSWLVGSNVTETKPVAASLENSNETESMVTLPQEDSNDMEERDEELPGVNEPTA